MMKMDLQSINDAPHGNKMDGRVYSKMTLTVNELACELGVSRNIAYSLVKRPGFPCFHLGKRILVNRAMLQTWMDQQCDPIELAMFYSGLKCENRK